MLLNLLSTNFLTSLFWWPFSAKLTPLPRSYFLLLGQDLGLHGYPTLPCSFSHISHFSNPGKLPPLLTSLHPLASRMGSYRSMHLSPAAPPPPHQGSLTTESLLTDSSFHSLQLIPNLAGVLGPHSSPLFFLSHLPLILPLELQRKRSHDLSSINNPFPPNPSAELPILFCTLEEEVPFHDSKRIPLLSLHSVPSRLLRLLNSLSQHSLPDLFSSSRKGDL